MSQCFQTGTVSPAIFCWCRENLFYSTALYTKQQSSLEDYLELSVMLQYNLAHSIL